jgi:hypothetical protein
MPEDHYSVKINRRDGVVEITGPDKGWIAEQLDRLSVVYEPEPSDPAPRDLRGNDADVVDETGTGGKPRRGKPKATEGEDGATRRRAKGGGYRGKRNDDLAQKLTGDVRGNLDTYVEERRANFTDGPNQAAILAAFLQTELGWDTVGPNDLYTIYDAMGWPGPNPRNALDNAKTRKNYFTSAGRGVYRLSHSGERFGRHEARTAPDS